MNLRLLTCLLPWLLGCAGTRAVTQQPVPLAPAPTAPKRLDVSEQAAAEAATVAAQAKTAAGVWDWLYRGNTQQGDVRIEQEEWHLQQDGAKISGYFHRQVLVLSSDSRPFRCNGMLGFAINVRVSVVGELQQGRVNLREVGMDVDRNACDDGRRELVSYTGQLRGDSLLLQLPVGTQQHLVRRVSAGSDQAMLGLGPDRGEPAREDAPIAVTGEWRWQFRGADPDGDLHAESEEWHLTETGNEISGYYIRSLERRRSAGVFACNNRAVIQGRTRFVVKGHRFGNKISLSEIDYQATPDPCDNSTRRLDHYQGTLHPEGTLVLSWSGGSQTLRRKL